MLGPGESSEGGGQALGRHSVFRDGSFAGAGASMETLVAGRAAFFGERVASLFRAIRSPGGWRRRPKMQPGGRRSSPSAPGRHWGRPAGGATTDSVAAGAPATLCRGRRLRRDGLLRQAGARRGRQPQAGERRSLPSALDPGRMRQRPDTRRTGVPSTLMRASPRVPASATPARPTAPHTPTTQADRVRNPRDRDKKVPGPAR